MKGTLLNVGTVVAGSTIGLLLGKLIPDQAQSMALSGLGLVTLGLGVKMFFQSKNVLLIAAGLSIGGVLGLLLGIQSGLDLVGGRLESVLQALHLNTGSDFTAGFVAATVLYCIGPMTLLGCIQDGIEGKSELLQLKSTLDGVASVFLAASLGVGVWFSAVSVLLIQGGLTLLAKRLHFLQKDEEYLSELSAAGGCIMMAIGFGLLEIKKIPTGNFLPALMLVPAMIAVNRWLNSRKLSTRAA